MVSDYILYGLGHRICFIFSAPQKITRYYDLTVLPYPDLLKDRFSVSPCIFRESLTLARCRIRMLMVLCFIYTPLLRNHRGYQLRCGPRC